MAVPGGTQGRDDGADEERNEAGLTPRRFWATTGAALALVGVVIGGLALARPAGRFGTTSRRLGASVALGATIHFSPDHPLPTALVRKILRARIRENAEVA